MKKAGRIFTVLVYLALAMILNPCAGNHFPQTSGRIFLLDNLELTGSPGEGMNIIPLETEVVNQRFNMDYRRCIEFPPEKIISVNLRDIPSNGRFTFAVAAKCDEDQPDASLMIETNLKTINGTIIPVMEGSAEDLPILKWHDFSVDLSEYEGGEIRIDIGISINCDGATAFLANPCLFSPVRMPERIILVCVDTLRADHLGVQGCQRGLTPNLDEFAGESIQFTNCHSPSPWTLPAIACSLVGRYPGTAGADSESFKLRSGEVTLAEVYKQSGYRTASIISNGWISRDTGFFQGYESEIHKEHGKANEIIDDTLNWLDGHQDEDFFLFVHFMDTHAPYDPPEPYLSQFRRGTGRFVSNFDEWGRLRGMGFRMSANEQEQVRGLYDGCVAYFDAEIGRLIGEMKERRIWDDSLFIVYGDHGEEFWEHGGGEHGHSLYEELLQVPLIIHDPSRGASVREENVSLVDIMPTILAWSGLENPTELNGVDLFGTEPDSDGDRFIFSEELLYGNEQKAVILGDWKFIMDFSGSAAGRLYNIADDPAERINRAANERELAEYLAGQLVIFTADTSPGFHVRVYPSERTGNSDFIVTATVEDGIFADPEMNLAGATIGTEETGDTRLYYVANIKPKGHMALDFMVEPEGAIVSIDVQSTPAVSLYFDWYLGATQTPIQSLDMTFSMTDHRIAWTHPQTFARSADGIYVWSFPPGVKRTIEEAVSPETLEELRSLGYIQ